MLAPIREAVEAQRAIFLRATQSEREALARRVLGAVRDAATWQLDTVAASVGISFDELDEAEWLEDNVRGRRQTMTPG
jgi:hypothetical protein